MAGISCTAAEAEKALTSRGVRGCRWRENKPRVRVLVNGLRKRREENVEKVTGTAAASLNLCKPIAGDGLIYLVYKKKKGPKFILCWIAI